MEKDYETECALDTLIRAKEIQSDDELMKKVQKLAKDKQRKINSIASLKKEYDKVVKEESEDESQEKSDQKEDNQKSVKIEIEVSSKSDLMTEEDKAALNDEKFYSKMNKGKLGELEWK